MTADNKKQPDEKNECQPDQELDNLDIEIGFLNKVENSLKLSENPPPVSPETDQAILAFISAKSGEIQEQNKRVIAFPFFAKFAAVAVLCLISLCLIYLSMKPAETTMPMSLASQSLVVNRDGSINIIDAYLIAKHQYNPETPEVRQIITKIVSLDKNQ